MRIAVLGAGAWGTALAIAFAGRHAVSLWARDPAGVADMAGRRENMRYLPACPFPSALQVTSELGAALGASDLAILAAPLAGLRTLRLPGTPARDELETLLEQERLRTPLAEDAQPRPALLWAGAADWLPAATTVAGLASRLVRVPVDEAPAGERAGAWPLALAGAGG